MWNRINISMSITITVQSRDNNQAVLRDYIDYATKELSPSESYERVESWIEVPRDKYLERVVSKSSRYSASRARTEIVSIKRKKGVIQSSSEGVTVLRSGVNNREV